MDEDYATPPYDNDFDPLLYVDGTVTLQPGNETYGVSQVEIIPTLDTQEFVVPANDTLNEVEMRGLYLQDGVLGQFRLFDPEGGQAIPDDIEITVDQGGEESPRFNTKNRRGFYSAATAALGENAQQTELFQYEDTDLFFNVTNTSGAEITFTLTYTGFAFDLVPARDLSASDTDVTVPVERLNLR